MQPNEFRREILVDFKCLQDTDLGVALYLRTNASNKDVFEDNIWEATLEYFRYMALFREEENPIAYMLKPEYKEQADSIYKQLFNNKWDKVCEFSPKTDILHMMILGVQNGYRITVNCLNEVERKVARDFCKGRFKTVVNEKDISKYDFLYMHYIADVEYRGWDIETKVVYLYDWRLNHAEFKSTMDDSISVLALPYVEKTVFNFINPYKDFIIPNG